jgi:hypothetical protein
MRPITSQDDREAERRATRWGTIPPSQLRLPLQLRGGSEAPAALIDRVHVADTTPPGENAPELLEEAEPEGVRPASALGALEELEEEEPEAVAERDPIARYLTEIGKAKLLTAAQEVEIGQRIENAQAELRRQLGAVPLALRAVTNLAERVRTRVITLDDLIVFPEGEPTPARVRSAMIALGRLRRRVAAPSRHRGRVTVIERARLESLNRLMRTQRVLSTTLGREPTPEELARSRLPRASLAGDGRRAVDP